MQRRSLIPFGLVGALTLLAVAAAVVGAKAEPSGTNSGLPTNDPEVAAQLYGLVERTLGASSFTEEIRLFGSSSPGSAPMYVVFNSPDRFELSSPTSNQPWMIDVGALQYTLGACGSGWTELRNPKDKGIGGGISRTAALITLKALLGVSSVVTAGHALVATSFTPIGPRSSLVETTFVVHSVHGHISEVRSTENSPEPIVKDLISDVRFSDINTSPTVATPAAHSAGLPTRDGPRGPVTAPGSCPTPSAAP